MVTKFFFATIIITPLLVFARYLSLTLLTLKWSFSESVNDLYLSETFRATFLDRKGDRQTDRVRNVAFDCLFYTCEYITSFQVPDIPHICHGRTDDVRVNFFWPV